MRCDVVNSKAEQCKNEVKVPGICATHSYRLKRYGDVRADVPIRQYNLTKARGGDITPGASDEERFWNRVRKTDKCWLWTGSQMTGGFGNAHFKGYTRGAHRVAWELAFGEIPEGIRIRQTCNDRTCVRLSHLEANFADGTPFYSAAELLAEPVAA